MFLKGIYSPRPPNINDPNIESLAKGGKLKAVFFKINFEI